MPHLNTAFCGASLRRAPTRYRNPPGTPRPSRNDGGVDVVDGGSSTASLVFLVLRTVLHGPHTLSPSRPPLQDFSGSEPPSSCWEKGSLSSSTSGPAVVAVSRHPRRPPGDQVALCLVVLAVGFVAPPGLGDLVPVVARRLLLGREPQRPVPTPPPPPAVAEEPLAFLALAVQPPVVPGGCSMDSCRTYSISWFGCRTGERPTIGGGGG